MRSFVDKVKAGKWGNVMSAVASLGAAATSVGVSAGVAAAEPLAKDLARGFEELTASVEVDPITRKQQVANRAKLEAERKRDAFERRAEEFSTEASKLEGTMKTRLEEQKEWNKALVERRIEVASARKSLEGTESRTKEAAEVASDLKASELAAAEKARQSRAAREEFLQASANTERQVSTAEATVTAAERRLWEALKTLDTARHMLALTYEEATALEGKRDQASFDTLIVMADTESAESVFAEAKEATLESKAALSQQRTDLALLQREFRESSRREEQASAKIKELGDAAESLGARAVRNRKSADESKVAARREAGAIDAAARQESRLAAEAVAAKAKLEAAAAAAQEEQAKRDRAEAARAAAEAVERARLAEQAAGAAAEAAIKAAMAARQATAEAVAAAETGEDPEAIGEMAPEHKAFEPMSSSAAVDAAGGGEHAPKDPTAAGEPEVDTLASSGTAAVPEPR
ncbi:unnamed protein product [Ectocarpus fasciculatus]